MTKLAEGFVNSTSKDILAVYVKDDATIVCWEGGGIYNEPARITYYVNTTKILRRCLESHNTEYLNNVIRNYKSEGFERVR